MNNDKILKEEEKLEAESVKNKSKRKGIIIGALTAGALAVAGVATGIALSKPTFLDIIVDSTGVVTINGEVIENGELSYKKGDRIVLVANRVEGYSFDGWYFNDEKIEGATGMSYEFILSEATQGKYEARYVKENYSIEVVQENQEDISGIEVNGDSSTNASIDDVISFVVADKTSEGKLERPYYQKTGEDAKHYISQVEGKYVFSMPGSGVKIGIDYDLIDYRIEKADVQNGSFEIRKGENIVSSANKGDTLLIIPFADEGYKIKKVSYLVEGDENPTEITINSDGEYIFEMQACPVKFIVEFEKRDFTVTAGDNIINLSSENVLFGETVTFGVSAKDPKEYTLKVYYTVGDSAIQHEVIAENGIYSFDMPAGNVTIIGEYTARTYNVLKNEENAQYILYLPTTAQFNSTVSFKVASRPRYVIERVYFVGNENGVETDIPSNNDVYSFTMPAENVTINVIYNSKTHAIENRTPDFIKNLDAGADIGDEVSFKVLDRNGYAISKVYYLIDDVETLIAQTSEHGIYSFEMPNRDIAVVAEYNIIHYTITKSPAENGSFAVLKNGEGAESATIEDVLTVSISPNENYIINELYYQIDGQATKINILLTDGEYKFDMPAGNITITATFKSIITSITENGLYYSLDYEAGEATIMGFDVTATDKTTVLIPATVTVPENNDRVYKVVAIRDADSFTKRGFGSHCVNGAFQDTDVENIDFSNATNLKYIGTGAFMGTKITEVSLPETVTEIGAYAFRTCQNLTRADFSKATQLKAVPYGCFYVDFNEFTTPTYSLTTFLAPTSLERIEADAFFTSGIAQIDLSMCENLNLVGYGAFESAINLRTAKLPKGNSGNKIVIESNAFKSTDSLLTIELPKYGEIKDNAFADAKNLIELVKFGGDYVSQTDIGRLGLSQNSGLPAGISVSIVDESKIKVGQNFAYYVIKEDSNVEVPYVLYYFGKSNDVTISRDNLNADLNEQHSRYAVYTQAFKGASIENLVIGSGVSSLGARSFNGCKNLKTINMSSASELKVLGDGVFQGCGNATEINIPESVETIGGSAFYAMNSIKSLDLSHLTNVTTIEASTFQEMKRVESIVLPSSITTINSKAFTGTDRLLTLTIPESVENLSEDIFATFDYYKTRPTAGHLIGIVNLSQNSGVKNNLITAVSRINRPNGYTQIYSQPTTEREMGITRTFAKISTASYGESCVRTVVEENTDSNSVFDAKAGEFIWLTRGGNKILAGYYSPAGLKAETATDEYYELKLPESGYSEIMANFAHYENNMIKVTIPSCVTKIGASAFQNCKMLASVDIPDSVTEIGDYAFQDIANSTSEVLTSVKIPTSVVSLGAGAFAGCAHLEKIYIDSISVWANFTPTQVFSGKNLTTEVYVLESIIAGGQTNANYSPGELVGGYYKMVKNS